MARSESSTKPVISTLTRETSPNAAGNNRRVRIRLLPRRRTCWAPNPDSSKSVLRNIRPCRLTSGSAFACAPSTTTTELEVTMLSRPSLCPGGFRRGCVRQRRQRAQQRRPAVDARPPRQQRLIIIGGGARHDVRRQSAGHVDGCLLAERRGSYRVREHHQD